METGDKLDDGFAFMAAGLALVGSDIEFVDFVFGPGPEFCWETLLPSPIGDGTDFVVGCVCVEELPATVCRRVMAGFAMALDELEPISLASLVRGLFVGFLLTTCQGD